MKSAQGFARPAANVLEVQDGRTDVHPANWFHLGFEKAAYPFSSLPT